ncbi:MAG: hypothetical protein ACE5JQ_12005 [Candidatus Methylomirabilales bacterium]
MYERECLIRSPRYLRDLKRLYQEHPGIFNAQEAPWPTDDQGRPIPFVLTRAEQEAMRAFKAKYPAIRDDDHLFAVLQPFPLLFDPAWWVSVTQADNRFHLRHGRAPVGLVTRGGVEPLGAQESEDTAEVYDEARRIFEAMNEQQVPMGHGGLVSMRTMWRMSLAPAVFEAARMLLPVGPDTNLEQVKRIWPAIEPAKRACYGGPSRKKASRPNIYDDRIRAYDLIHGLGQTVTEAARIAGKHPRALLRRFHEALRDIEGVKGKLTDEGFAEHVAACPKCREAETQGSSDLYCSWMQRQLGARTGKIKGSTSLAEEEDIRGERWRGGQDL